MLRAATRASAPAGRGAVRVCRPSFYVGSAFVAFSNHPYHEFFIENVPLGASFIQYAEDHDWDTLTVQKVIQASTNGVAYIQHLISGGEEKGEKAIEKTKEVYERTKDASKERIQSVAQTLKTTVRKTEEKVAGGAKKAAISKHQATQFSRPELTSPDNVASTAASETQPSSSKKANVYDAPLPPAPKSSPAPPAKDEKVAPPPAPLPLVAPVVAELGATEPVISQLASVIDNLASYLNSNPAAATKARDVLENAKDDIKILADRFDQMEAQDKLDSQEEGFRHFFEEEKAKFIQAYREKLNQELRTQSEIINERLKEEVIAQGIELQRRWIREIKIRVEQERGGRLAKLDELSTNLKRLERIALDNGAYLDENIRVHALWSAIRALGHAVDGAVRKPFRDELRVVRHIAAAREDPVVIAALDPWNQNAGLLSHLASHLLSSFSFKRQGLVEGDDVLSVLARAEYYLNEKDLDSATRELNQLRGTAKVLLSDWLSAARKRLEVSQALEIVQSQATLASLLVSQH
ncbi:mitochondrial inner membrane protein-domain-containing protein [Irpex lacteus]|nr:mitochondrial inner membrane protein-domain-containing protein [Irpex lacteus]